MLWLASVAAWGYAAEEVVTKGPDYGGIAAIIAASAGVISAIGAIIIGLRTKSGGDNDAEKELLMELLKEQLKKDDPPGPEQWS